MSLSDFRSRFEEQSRYLDEKLQFENDANKQLLQEKWERAALKTFVADLKSIGQPLSDSEVTALVQYMLDNQFDTRVAGAYTVAYVRASGEGVFEKLRAEEIETEAEAERLAIKKPTIAETAPTVIKVEGNRTITTYRREGDEGIPAEDMEALRPENLTKSKLKELKFKSLQSRQEHMTEQAKQSMDRGERIR